MGRFPKVEVKREKKIVFDKIKKKKKKKKNDRYTYRTKKMRIKKVWRIFYRIFVVHIVVFLSWDAILSLGLFSLTKLIYNSLRP